MIFKRLFQPKYKHPDAQQRLHAIAELTPDNPEQKSILHELAFNDGSADVSIAALEKLNSFPLWNKMAEIASDEKVRKAARRKVEQLLLAGKGAGLDAQQKRDFIMQSKDFATLELLLRQDPLVQQDLSLVRHILEKVDKTALFNHVFYNVLDASAQLQFLPEFDSDSDLQRIIKKVDNDDVRQAAQALLAEREAQANKPKEIAAAAKLVLAKLLALRDEQDFGRFSEQRQTLTDEFGQLAEQFDCLADTEAATFNEKYAQLTGKLDSTQQVLQQRFDEQQQQREAKQRIESAEASARRVLSSLNDTLDGEIQTLSQEQITDLEQQLLNASDALSTALSDADIDPSSRAALESLLNRLMMSRATIDKLPALQTACEKALQLIENLATEAIPENVEQMEEVSRHLSELSERYRSIKNAFADWWPERLDKQWQKARKPFQQAMNALQEQIKQSESRVRNKLRAVESLIKQGRFRPAMGLFKKVSSWYAALPEKAQLRLQRQYQQVQQDVEELQGWQEYIAQPRKPAMLEQAQQLASQPVTDHSKRAEEVKKLRAEWASLGVLQSDEDSALNTAFDDALERAFAPCRGYFAQRQQQRQESLAQKQAILDELSQFDLEQDTHEVEHAYRHFLQRWQTCGEVERGQRDKVAKAFSDAIAPLKQQAEAFYQQNAERKKSLITQASALADEQDAEVAAEQAKQLQQSWKNIGFAGHKKDNKLWREFRRVNDAIFANLGEQRQAHRNEVDEQVEQAKQLITQLRTLIDESGDNESLKHAQQQQKMLHSQLDTLPARQRQKLDSAVSECDKALAKKRLQAQQQQRQRELEALFSTLESWREGAQPPVADDVPPAYRQWFKVDTQATDLSRDQLTVMMEILADVPSPQSEQEKRKALQLQMMADKLENGEQQSQEALLMQWVSKGPLAANDIALLQRLRRSVDA
ncbi:DUF349 domain-containing protein [Aestuariibacter salexigens]|uniref:DUF349 domain-containing protein n=1 Tax=Aestuariibacter salexigens TaxID=226010 RepID=UPI000418A46E|nr:DUF349 domain-containing protein [Aestuariibacter salexigens]